MLKVRKDDVAFFAILSDLLNLPRPNIKEPSLPISTPDCDPDDDQRGFDAITRGGNQEEKCHSQAKKGFIIQSDIDVLCVVPCFANMVDAKVPLMRFKFDGIPVDLPYGQLKVVSIPGVSSDDMSLMAAALGFFISQAIVTLPNRTGVEKHPFMFSRTGVRKHPFMFPVCNYIRDEIKVKDVNQQNPTVAAMRDMASELTSGMDTTLS
nr:nuclear poly(A) polymerase 3 [Ipomoea batatas]